MTGEPRPSMCLVVSPDHPDEAIEIEIPYCGSPDPGAPFVYVRVPQTFSIELLDFELDRILKSRTDDVTTVVIRCHGATYEALRKSPDVRSRLDARFPYAEVLLLSWSRGQRAYVLEDAETGREHTDDRT